MAINATIPNRPQLSQQLKTVCEFSSPEMTQTNPLPPKATPFAATRPPNRPFLGTQSPVTQSRCAGLSARTLTDTVVGKTRRKSTANRTVERVSNSFAHLSRTSNTASRQQSRLQNRLHNDHPMVSCEKASCRSPCQRRTGDVVYGRTSMNVKRRRRCDSTHSCTATKHVPSTITRNFRHRPGIGKQVKSTEW